MSLALDLARIGAVTYVFWLLFIVYAGASKNWSRLTLWPRALLLPLGVFFYVLDVAFNVTVGTVIFWQWPTLKTATLSMRMAANKLLPVDQWRYRLAAWICGHLIDPFLQNHC